MSQQTTSDENLTVRDRLEYAVEATKTKIGLTATRHPNIRGLLRSATRFAFPQWLRTSLVAFFEMSVAMTWLAATSTPDQMAGAISIALLHPIAVGVAAHVWPTRTPPWRTLVWTWLTSWLVAAVLYVAWGVDWALYVAIGVIIVITAARCNANARRVWNWLVQRNVQRQFGTDVTLITERPTASARAAKAGKRN